MRDPKNKTKKKALSRRKPLGLGIPNIVSSIFVGVTPGAPFINGVHAQKKIRQNMHTFTQILVCKRIIFGKRCCSSIS